MARAQARRRAEPVLGRRRVRRSPGTRARRGPSVVRCHRDRGPVAGSTPRTGHTRDALISPPAAPTRTPSSPSSRPRGTTTCCASATPCSSSEVASSARSARAFDHRTARRPALGAKRVDRRRRRRCARHRRCARNLIDHGESGPLPTLIGWLHAPRRSGDRRVGAAAFRRRLAAGRQRLLPADPRHLRPVRPAAARTREAAIETVLAHTEDDRWLRAPRRLQRLQRPGRHPSALAGRPADRLRRAESGRRWAKGQLAADRCDRWIDGAGFGFAPDAADERSVPGLQGTEMWLAIVWLLSRLPGCVRRARLPAPRRSPP